MTDDTITRARAAVARLRGSVKVIHSPQPIGQRELDDALGSVHTAAPALLALAEAVGRLRARSTPFASAWEIDNYVEPFNEDGETLAAEIDAALADLAALAGDADAGEVGA